MKQVVFILATLQFVSQLLIAQNPDQAKLDDFNRFLGKERALVMQDAVDCFDQFLANNYPDSKNQAERIKSFLKQITELNGPDSSWVYECDRKIIESFESTGLRKEIWLYEHEEYKSEHDFSEVLPPPSPGDTTNIKELGEVNLNLIEEEIIPIGDIDQEKHAKIQKEHEERIKNFLQPNGKGTYIFALLKYSPQESFVYDYAQMIREENRISPGVVASGFLLGAPL
jgi:hypothetical protein